MRIDRSAPAGADPWNPPGRPAWAHRAQHQINCASEKLHVTPELVITSTTGIGHPLACPVKVAQYAAEGDTAKLVRRIESDVKAL